jgi:hypothetical protein
MAFRRESQGWMQRLVDAHELRVPFSCHDLAGCPQAEQGRVIERICTETQGSLQWTRLRCSVLCSST